MTRTVLVALAMLVGALAPVRAETVVINVTVAAGEVDRINTPVHVLLSLPAPISARSVVLHDPSDRAIQGQVTMPSLVAPVALANQQELHFILPRLKAGQTITYRATLSTEPLIGIPHFTWHDTPGEFTELRLGPLPVLRYQYKALDESSKEAREHTFKVYHHLFDPEGTRLVTKGPGGHYTHHRGLFYGFNKVSYGDNKKADVWHCTGDAHQSHEKILSSEAGPVLGRHRVLIAWHGPGKEVFAREERELTVYNTPGGRLIEFASKLVPTMVPVKLDGDPQHAGFHFRGDNEVDAITSKQTYYLRPDGQGKPGETRNWDPKTRQGPVNLPWNAMSFVLGGRRYTVAYLDRPQNPKEARFSERDYGRFGSYFEYTLTADKPLLLDYRIWLQDGEMTGAAVNRLDRDLVEPPVVTVK